MLDDDILWMDTILQKAFNEDSTTVMSWRRIKKALVEGQKPTTNSASRAIAAIQGALKIKELWQPPQGYSITENNPHYEEYVALQKMLNEFESVAQQQQA